MNNDSRCPLTDLLTSQCAHCQGPQYGPWILSPSAGLCARCKACIQRGDPVRAGNGGHVCEDCGQDAP